MPLAALGFAGPLTSGGGSVGTALQRIVDSEGFEEILLNSIGALGTIIDGSVNGGYGPNLAPLVQDLLIAANPALAPLAALGVFPSVLSGGLINSDGAVLGTIKIPPGCTGTPATGCITIPNAPLEITLPWRDPHAPATHRVATRIAWRR